MRRLIPFILLICAGVFPAACSAEPEAPAAASPPPAVTATAPALPAGLEPAGHGEVTGIVDGDTVTLRDGRQVRLVGIQAPKLSLGRAHVQDWPLAHEAKAALAGLVMGERVTLHTGDTAEDRHGRVLAHIVRQKDDVWVQGELLRVGWARVYTFADNRRAAAAMLALEREARAARRGIWAHSFYAIRTPENVGRRLDQFEIVEGTVRAVAEVKGRVYLNFGDDWRRDFTVKIERQNRKAFSQADLNPTQWQNQHLRVRGWVFLENGPMIEASHPEQIELLPPTR